MDRQANLLLRTEGKYDWAKIKKAVELLYPSVVVRPAVHAGKGRARGAHEAHQAGQSDQYQAGWNWDLPEHGEAAAAIEDWIYNNDPVEALAEQHVDHTTLPEGLARDLHTCFASHRENRQKLARAVQARGYYVNKGQSKGGKKGGKGKPGKGKGGKGKSSGGKARGGMSLDELKASTTCSSCGQMGHWHDDPQCPNNRKSNVVDHDGGAGDGDAEQDEGGDYYEEWGQDWGDEWADEWYHDAPQTRSSNAAVRNPPGVYAKESLYHEASQDHQGPWFPSRAKCCRRKQRPDQFRSLEIQKCEKCSQR